MKTSILLLALFAPIFLWADDYQPRNSQKEGEHPPTPQEALEAITVPEGFEVTLFAGEPDVHQPVAMTTDDRGRIWVAESYSYKEWKETGEDRIVILEDTDNDGVHDKRTVFWTGGNHVSGMTVGWGGVWVCSSPNLLFIPDRDGDDMPDGEPEIVLDGWTTKAGHNFFNGLKWGIDGWLYGRHGITAPSFVGKPGTPDEERVGFDCAIWRYHPVTEKFEVVCRGTTNPWGHDWDELGELFFTNNVNGHLWHAIPGALFPRMSNRPDANVKFDYERIPMVADHLHHAGTIGDWTKTRDGKGVHGDLGGGHSHCGGMIYLGDNWPSKYHGRIFMSNTHGRRLNQNILEREGSGFVGKRAPDFMFANQPWFRGVTVMYGPDGGVFVSDWTDLGECHDNDGVHRTSGRIFKITYGKPEKPSHSDFAKLSTEELIQLQTARNEWHVRHARRILAERHAAGEDMAEFHEKLRSRATRTKSNRTMVRALLTLHVIGAADEDFLLSDVLTHHDEHVRKWAVRLLFDHGAPSAEALKKMVELAKTDPSPLVRLYLASGLQKLEFEDRLELAAALLNRTEDANDKNIPLMIWYGMKDAIGENPVMGIGFIDLNPLPKLDRFTARLICEVDGSNALLGGLLERHDEGLAEGMIEGLAGRTDLKTPENWAKAKARLEPELAVQLGLLLDRDATIAELQKRGDAEALEMLITAKAPGLGEQLLAALESEKLRKTALRGLARVSHPQAAETILTMYPNLPADQQLLAIETLTNTKKNAAALLGAIADERIPRSALTAFQARQIHGMKDNGLKKQLAEVWGELKSSDGEKKATIKSFQDQLLPDVLAQADLKAGHELYTRSCSACHTFFGEGGKIGPDLTGANRDNVFYLLENIIDPSATLPKDFHVTIITKKDGQVVTGNIGKKTDYTLTLLTPTGEVIIKRDEIKTQTTSPVSLMPEGMLNGLEFDQVRDLIAYLMRK
ncbi:MAG: putative membrane-bound dehydrogenase-like protein [Verrucomicrobiales bacterium]|jgi:putative membrane-bound dehydrogenase-like protein